MPCISLSDWTVLGAAIAACTHVSLCPAMSGMTASSISSINADAQCALQVVMYLNSPEIVVQPSVNDLKKVLGRLARNQVEGSKPFVRWMSGTCIETPEVRGASDDDEPFVHTFFTDVSQNPQIVKTMLTLTHSTQKVIFGITR